MLSTWVLFKKKNYIRNWNKTIYETVITLHTIIKKGSPLIYDTWIKLHTKLGYNNSSVIID